MATPTSFYLRLHHSLKKNLLRFGIVSVLIGQLAPATVHAQANDFRIGLYSPLWCMYRHNSNLSVTNVPQQVTGAMCDTVPFKLVGTNLYPTSASSQFSRDGFNMMIRYAPGTWSHSEKFLGSMVKMDMNYGMKEMFFLAHFFVPRSGTYNSSLPEPNCYNDNLTGSPWFMPADLKANDIWESCKARPNFDLMFSQVSNRPDLINGIWGYHVLGEFNYSHYFNSNHMTQCWGGDVQLYREVPPQNLSDAIGYFRTKIPANQKQMLAFANHYNSINDNTDDFEFITVGSNPYYAVENAGYDFDYSDYTNLANKPDYYFEESYETFPHTNWQTHIYSKVNNTGGPPYPDGTLDPTEKNDHYLSKFHNIDYLRSKGREVQSTIYFNVNNSNPMGGGNSSYHSNPSVQNANWLWFKAYTSIIHKAHGVNFYADELWTDSELSAGKDDYISSTFNNDRFTQSRFPAHYLDYVSNLTQEMAYLAQNNFVSTAIPIVATKTNQADPNCIVPPATGNSYIRTALVHKYGSFLVNTQYSLQEKISEDYGLRYTIRDNGTDAIMIITNPLNLPVEVTLNFSSDANPIVRNSTGVDVLFENVTYTSLGAYNGNASTYKTGKTYNSSGVNLLANTCSVSNQLNYVGNKQLTLVFGPMDTHVLKFRKDANFNVAGYNNGWDAVWSNNGSGIIGDWGPNIQPSDKFIPIDVNSDGDEELLCVLGITGNAWATVLDYDAVKNEWFPMWSNKGNGTFGYPTASGWGILAADKFYAGDFDKSGKNNELLCVQGDGQYATILRFNTSTNNFDWYWSNNGNGTFSYPIATGWTITSTDKFEVGDFNGDGKNNELLCVQGINGGFWAILSFNPLAGPANFQWLWGNGSGVFTSSTTWSINAGDEFRCGDYNGDGIRNELLCTERTSGLKAGIVRMNSGTWTSVWNNSGSGVIGGWGTPLNSTDKVLVGDIDNTDIKDEFMFIQRCTNCGWATTEDLSATNQPTWNWSNHNYSGTQQDFIDEWDVRSSSSYTNYFFIKAKAADKKYLFALRSFKCNKYEASMFKSLPGNRMPETSPTEQTAGIPVQDMNLKVWPNPADNRVEIEIPETITGDAVITIYNSVGQIVGKDNWTIDGNHARMRRKAIETSGLSNGLYLVVFETGQQKLTSRLMIQH
ncbi:MAG: hypothetical protein FD123_4348 [Bacteroidetes bacterium]|nr:MAG: hypothetical protein FD123_4348 [Bacteroidota bacterium]